MATRLEPSKPKRHQGELARRLAREKVMCPGCGKYMAVATLQYTHVCAGAATKEQTEEAIQRRLEVAKGRAIDAFRNRHSTRLEESNMEASDGDMEV